MTENDDRAPEAPEPAQDKTLSWWPLGGAALLAVAVGSLIVFAGSGQDNHPGTATESDGALKCPALYEQHTVQQSARTKAWVPVGASGVDGTATLVPDGAPAHAVLCAYSPAADQVGRQAQVKLDGRKELGAGINGIGSALSSAPKFVANAASCASITPSASNYLMGLTYATGVVWVSVPADACTPATNGDFVTSLRLGDRLKAAYESGIWA